MKNLITLLIVLLTVTSYGQRNPFKKKSKEVVVGERELITPSDWVGGIVYIGDMITDTTFDRNLVIKEFTRLVDSVREYKHNRDLIPSIINPLMSDAAKHHNNYLTNMVNPKNPNSTFIGHGELKNELGHTYKGNDTLIDSSRDRVTYFTDSTINSTGEVVQVGPLRIVSNQNTTEKDIAMSILRGFWVSPDHMEILLSAYYINIGADMTIFQDGDGWMYYFTFDTGVEIVKTIVESEYYYPNNPLGLQPSYTTYSEIVNNY